MDELTILNEISDKYGVKVTTPDDRKAHIAAMRRKGLTYEEIGKQLGVTRQRVYTILNPKRKSPDHFHPGAVSKIPYVGLRNWMMENRVGKKELYKRCGMKKIALNGDNSLKMDTVSKLLEITGLTFDECFRRDM